MNCQNNPTTSISLFSKSFQFGVDNAGSYARVLCVFFIPFIAYKYGFLSSDQLNKRMAIMTSYETVEFLRWIVAGLFGIFFIVHNLSVLFATDQLFKNSRISVWECYKKAAVKLPLFIAHFLQYIIRVLLWSLLLVVPGIIKLVQYSFAPIIYLIEGKRAKESFQLSEQIIRPFRISVGLALLLLSGFIFAMSFAVRDFLDALIYLLMLENLGWAAFVLDIGQGFLLLFIFIFPIVFLYRSYQTLINQKGGG